MLKIIICALYIEHPAIGRLKCSIHDHELVTINSITNAERSRSKSKYVLELDLMIRFAAPDPDSGKVIFYYRLQCFVNMQLASPFPQEKLC